MSIILNGTTGITTPGINNTGAFTFGGAIDLPGGTVGAPSLTTTGDLDTGIYFPAANQIAISTAGVQRLVVGATGNFDVKGGTTASMTLGGTNISTGECSLEIGNARTGSGYAYIDLVGDTTYSDYGFRLIRSNSGANANTELLHRGTGTLVLLTSEAAPISFWTSNSERARITSDGQLLVGTTTTTNNIRLNAKLSVVSTGAGNLGGALFPSYSGSTDIAAASFIEMSRSRGTTDGSMTAVASGDYTGYLVYRGADGTAFRDSAAVVGIINGTVSSGVVPGALTFYTTNSAGSFAERVRINAAGNVGIGTTTANGKLQFAGDINARKIVLYEGANNDFQNYGFGVLSATLLYSTYSVGDDHVFAVGTSSTTRKELMRINSTYNAVQIPGQPGFKQAWASRVSTGSSRILGTNQGDSLVTGRDEFNQGSHFSTATGKFTCPVAGMYVFGISLMRFASSGSVIDVRIYKNGGVNSMWARTYASAYTSDYQQSMLVTITDAAANDYFEFFIGPNTSMYDDDTYCFGYLIG